MNKSKALVNVIIYTGDQIITWKSILIKEGKIEDIVDESLIPSEYERFDMEGAFVSPGFIDVQIYGTGDDLFSADITADCIQRIEENLLKQGCTSFYLTLATNTIELFKRAIQIFNSASPSTALGLHLEGPFLNAKKKGAHPEQLILPISVDILEDLFAYSNDAVKIMTIAPELANKEAMAFLKSKNVMISAGHSDASFTLACTSFDNGIGAVTHLWNAMSPLHHREGGLPAAVLSHPTICASIIVDGIHVDYNIVKLSKKLMHDRLFLITDAVASCNKDIYKHVLNEDHYVLPDGTLSGSALSMMKAVRNCVEHAEIALDEALRMATLYPARLMGLQDLGRLEKNCIANIAVFDVDFEIKHVFLSGEKVV